MNTYDNSCIGTCNPNHPANQPEPTPMKADCLQQAFENYAESPSDETRMELQYYINEASRLTADELRTKVIGIQEALHASHNVVAKNKLSNLLKSI